MNHSVLSVIKQKKKKEGYISAMQEETAGLLDDATDESLVAKVWTIAKLGVPAIISIGMFFL